MKKIIVISAVNVRSGGPLSILRDLLNYLDTSLANSYRVIALVHSKSIAPNIKNIHFIEFPKSASSYLYRLYYEYFYFYKLSKELNPYLWLSLHDMTARVNATIQAVYCQNPSPFYKLTKKDFFLDKNFALMNFLYKFIYQINIQQNNFVIVQQNWMKDEFKRKDIDILDVLHCPHLPNLNCNCRKPKIGMIKELNSNFLINLKKSIFIGDRITDYNCARKSKIRYIYKKDIKL